MLPHPAAVVLAILAAAPATDAVERHASCRGVATEYEIARAEVRDAVAAYQKCLAADASPNGCAQEFSDLDFTQDRFEHASALKQSCNRR